jgi:hypothetical protein
MIRITVRAQAALALAAFGVVAAGRRHHTGQRKGGPMAVVDLQRRAQHFPGTGNFCTWDLRYLAALDRLPQASNAGLAGRAAKASHGRPTTCAALR